MTIANTAQALPRLLVQGYLHAARIPLNAVARVARQQDNEQWPPTLAFETFEAEVETVVGSVLRDSALIETGHLRQAKVAQLRKAAELSTVADKERATADKAAAQRGKQIDAQREATERREAERKKDIEHQAEAAKRGTRTKATKKAAAAREVKAGQDQAIDRQARAAKADALESEARALEIVKEGLEAEDKVDLIEATIEGTAAARKSG